MQLSQQVRRLLTLPATARLLRRIVVALVGDVIESRPGVFDLNMTLYTPFSSTGTRPAPSCRAFSISSGVMPHSRRDSVWRTSLCGPPEFDHGGGDCVGACLAHVCISWRRFSKRSPRRYAASTLLPMVCASAISTTSDGKGVVSDAQSRELDRSRVNGDRLALFILPLQFGLVPATDAGRQGHVRQR